MKTLPPHHGVRGRRGVRSVQQRRVWCRTRNSASDEGCQREGAAVTTQSEQQRREEGEEEEEQTLSISSSPQQKQQRENETTTKGQQPPEAVAAPAPARVPRRVRVIRVEKSKALEGVAAVSSSSSSGGDEYTMNFDEYVRRAAMLYAGDAAAILLPGSLPASAAHVAAWTLSAAVLGSYGYTRVMTRDSAEAAKAALTTWSVSIALSLGVVVAAGGGELPSDGAAQEEIMSIAISAVLVCAWRGAVAALIRPQLKSSTGDRKGSSLDLFQLLASLTRRW